MTDIAADTAEARAATRAMVAAGKVNRTPVSGTIIAAILDLTHEQLNSMFTAIPVGGWDGHQVAEDIAKRFQLYPTEPLGRQLADKGILTSAEGEWLDDVD